MSLRDRVNGRFKLFLGKPDKKAKVRKAPEKPPEAKTSEPLSEPSKPSENRLEPYVLELNGLWDEAYELLRKEDEQLIEVYKNDLLDQLEQNESGTDRDLQLRKLVEQRLHNIQNSQLKVTVGGKAIVVRDQARRVIHTILSVKDFITTAVSSEPHAALAWAGVLVLLDPLAKSVTQDEDAMQGFEAISNLLIRYRVMERTHIEVYTKKSDLSTTEPPEELSRSLRAKTVKLYAEVLRYQIRLAKQYSRAGFFRFLRDLAVADKWKQMFETITELDRDISDDLRAFNDHILNGIHSRVAELQNQMETSLTLAAEARDEAKASKQVQLLDTIPYAAGAAFDSFEDQHKPRCLEGTQINVLSRIQAWSDDPNGKLIYWLKGMAGTGKSTISRTVAIACHDRIRLVSNTQLSDNTCLGASFFFDQSKPDRNNAKKFVTTLSRNLTQVVPDLRTFVCEAIEIHPNIGNESLRNQWKHLIFHPLLALERLILSPLTLILVIDALDECEPQSDWSLIFDLMSEVKNLKTIRMRIFVTSRPEARIDLGLHGTLHDQFQIEVLSKVSTSPTEDASKDDITLFLEHEAAEIRKKHFLMENWPGDKEIKELSRKADGLFIYAATASRFIGAPGLTRSRMELRLNMIFDDKVSGNSPQSTLDAIYTRILQFSVIGDAIEEEKEEISGLFKQIVGSIIVLFQPLSVSALSDLLLLPREKVEEALEGLSSVLSVPKDDMSPIELLHLSFRDFLLDRQRCRDGDFWTDQKTQHEFLLQSCLKIMSNMLRENICSLEEPWLYSSEVDPGLIHRYLPVHLQYACRSWVYHLRQSNVLPSDNGDVHNFLKIHFLHWLEVLSLIGKTSEGVRMVVDLWDHLSTLPQKTSCMELKNMVHDARRFVLKFASLIETTALQIYSSVLIFSPELSIIRNLFKDRIPKRLKKLPKVETDWDPLLVTLERGYGGNVALSPDGKLVASPAVCVWDTSTGTLLRNLEPLGSYGKLVAFSLDGKLVLSVSEKGNVRAWDVATGVLVREVRGTSQSIPMAVMSKDKMMIATLSEQTTITLLDVGKGAVVKTFVAHQMTIMTMVLSPDGKWLATASEDTTVRLWDTVTGELALTLEPCSEQYDLAFSTDSKLLAATDDCTLRVWDSVTGKLLRTIEDLDYPRDVIFSPDGEAVCCSGDDSVFSSWDPVTGRLLGRIEGDIIGPVFSPDGKLITSVRRQEFGGYQYQTVGREVKLWDYETKALVKALRGHSQPLVGASFSPDRKLLATTAEDNTVRLWDLSTLTSAHTVEAHESAVKFIEFSPDGKLIASAADDETVRLWSVETSALLWTFSAEFYLRYLLFSPDGKFVAASHKQGIIGLWDTSTGVMSRRLKAHAGQIRLIAFSRDSKLLASICQQAYTYSDDSIYKKVYGNEDDGDEDGDSASEKDSNDVEEDSLDNDEETDDHEHDKDKNKVEVEDDDDDEDEDEDEDENENEDEDEEQFSGRNDLRIQLWDVTTGTLLHTLEGHSRCTNSIEFSPDGKLLASASDDTTVRLWDTAVGKECKTLHGHSAKVSVVAFSSDGRIVASGSQDQKVILWETSTGRMMNTLVHLHPVYRILFAPNEKLLACEGGGRVRFWNPATGVPLGECEIHGSIISFSSGSEKLITTLGHIDVQSICPGISASMEPLRSQEIFVESGWVVQGTEKVLLLPHDYGGTLAAARNNVLVIGFDTGRISILGF